MSFLRQHLEGRVIVTALKAQSPWHSFIRLYHIYMYIYVSPRPNTMYTYTYNIYVHIYTSSYWNGMPSGSLIKLYYYYMRTIWARVCPKWPYCQSMGGCGLLVLLPSYPKARRLLPYTVCMNSSRGEFGLPLREVFRDTRLCGGGCRHVGSSLSW
jgi:hypothetical protein